MSLNICMDCKFEKKRCQCIIESIITEENMIKKIKNKIKSIWNKIISLFIPNKQ
jgi:hypothetical protein